VTAFGYTSYYLNFLAGSAHSLANADDPAYTWAKSLWTGIDRRLPIVTHEMEK
jgi:5-deoxy-glucuronate isomerase